MSASRAPSSRRNFWASTTNRITTPTSKPISRRAASKTKPSNKCERSRPRCLNPRKKFSHKNSSSSTLPGSRTQKAKCSSRLHKKTSRIRNKHRPRRSTIFGGVPTGNVVGFQKSGKRTQSRHRETHQDTDRKRNFHSHGRKSRLSHGTTRIRPVLTDQRSVQQEKKFHSANFPRLTTIIVLLSDGIKTDALFAGITQIEKDIQATLAKTPEEKNVIA